MVDQIAKIGQNVSNDGAPSPETHRELQDLARKLSFALERPHETMMRLVFVVSLSCSAASRMDVEH